MTRGEKSYLNASSQSSQSVSNICSSPEMCPVNDAVLQRAKLYQRMQVRETSGTEIVLLTTND